jgi:dolichyl-phosphate-mannose-protein mannosyltransferase
MPGSTEANNGEHPRVSLSVPLIIAAIYFLAHMATATRYGYFRDALYYLACTEHLAWGYVDQPPLFVFVAWFARHTLGTSLPALIFWPALAGAARIVLTAAFARELGAKKFGVALAAVLAATPAVWYAIDHQFGMNAFDPLFWTGCAFAILRLIKTENPQWWIVFGAIAGLGLENKYAIGFYAACLLAGLLITPQRKFLFSPWLLAGGAVALLLFIPNLIWNVQHHWPFLELMRNIRASGRDVVLSPAGFLGQQVIMTTPLALPFNLFGLYFYFSAAGRTFRVFGWTFVFTITFFLLAHGKDYYTAPVYPLALAAGAVATERFLLRRASRETDTATAAAPSFAVQLGVFAYLFVAVALLLPVVLPVLPIGSYLSYQDHLPFAVPKSEHNQDTATLPQHYSDEFGWQEMVAKVADVYHSLPPEEQTKTAIFTTNYGEAAAIDFFGPQYGLPKAICTHQNYFLWGPRQYTGEIVIRVGLKPEDAVEGYEDVKIAATLNNPYTMPHEKNPILLCRHRKANFQTDWPNMKNWD